MTSQQADFLDMARFPEQGRHQQTLTAFLAASLLAHLAIIIGFPDFFPQFSAPETGVIEVTILEPQRVPAPAVEPQPEQARAVETPKPRPSQRKEARQPAAKPAARSPAPATPSPTPDTEAEGSLSAGPPREAAPPATGPEPSAKAPARQVTPPVFDAAYLSNPAPQYPPAARRAGQQGTVRLRVTVKRDGLPSRVDIEKSSGYRLLDAAARDQVWNWRFVPARQGTDAIESSVVVPVVFRLEGSL